MCCPSLYMFSFLSVIFSPSLFLVFHICLFSDTAKPITSSTCKLNLSAEVSNPLVSQDISIQFQAIRMSSFPSHWMGPGAPSTNHVYLTYKLLGQDPVTTVPLTMCKVRHIFYSFNVYIIMCIQLCVKAIWARPCGYGTVDYV